MRTIPRIGGTLWPACVFLVLILLLPIAAVAQQPAGGGEEPFAGAAAEEPTQGEESVVEAEDAVSVISGEPGEILEVVPEEALEVVPIEYEFDFQKPDGFQVADRANDEGGGFALRWLPSPSDESMTEITDPETGETSEVPAYEYWVFHSPTGEPGSWEQTDAFPTNSQYNWELPQYFGFFLSPIRKGANEHYSFYENWYPDTGVYEYSIGPVTEENPSEIVVTAKVYDTNVSDYRTLRVFCDLRPLGGERIELAYQDPEPGALPWDNVYSATTSFDPDEVKTTKNYYLIFTANVRGVDKAALEAQPTLDIERRKVVSSAGNEQPVPDNRDPHYFRLYVAPTGYIIPEGEEFPPDEWMIGSQAGPEIASQNWWNGSRTNSALWALLICVAVMTYIAQARGGASLFVRRIAGLDHVDEAIGRATEMGRPILYTTGLGYISDIATIASINILGRVARKVADYESRLLVPSRDPIIMAVCQETIQEAFIDAGRPDAYNKDDVFFLTDDQFAYTAAVSGIMVREKPATNFLIGYFYAESLLLAETGASTGAIQIAGTDALAQLPFFITACDYTLIGEELYAASAYLSREPLLLGSLKGQDFAKMIFMIFTFIGTILIMLSLNWEFIKQLFQAY